MFKTLGIKTALEKPDCKLIAYSGDMLKTHGMLNLDCSYRKRNVKTRFYIVHTNAPPLISTQTSIDWFDQTYLCNRQSDNDKRVCYGGIQ